MRHALAAMVLLFGGCSLDRAGISVEGDGGPTDVDAGRDDAGPPRDVGPRDVGPRDAPLPDAPDLPDACTPTGDLLDDCDLIDDDCDMTVDEDCECVPDSTRPCAECGDGVDTCVAGRWAGCVGGTTRTTYYLDADGDTVGGATSMLSCVPIPMYVTTTGDCDDGCPTCFPGGSETCDGADNDCDTMIDDGVGDVWYPDADRDGHGQMGAGVMSCSAPMGFVMIGDDCDDDCARCRPDFPMELCGDMADNDCNDMTDEPACPCDYFEAAGGEYAYCETGSSWGASRTRCTSIGGDLASLETRAENDAVWARLDPYDTWVWFGLGERSPDGAWIWTTGVPLGACSGTLCNWYPGQPNGGGAIECAVMRVDWTGRWGDIGCGTEYPSVCQL